jgi:hypothetical protein
MVKYDKKKLGYLSKELFVHALDAVHLTSELNDQEMLTVMRRFKNDHHMYQYDELCDLFSHSFYIKTTGRRQSYAFSGRNNNNNHHNNNNTNIENSAFLDMLRGNKTQIRR